MVGFVVRVLAARRGSQYDWTVTVCVSSDRVAYEPSNALGNTFQNPFELPRIYNSWCPVQTLFPSLYSLQIGGGRRPLLGWMSTTLLPAPYPHLNVFVTSESLRRLRSYFCLQLPVRLNQQGPAHDGAAPLKG